MSMFKKGEKKEGSGGTFAEYYRQWGYAAKRRMAESSPREFQREFDRAEARWDIVAELLEDDISAFPEELFPLLPKTLLYYSSIGMLSSMTASEWCGDMVTGFKMRRGEALLRMLKEEHPELLPHRTTMAEAPFFEDVGELGDNVCGKFWRACAIVEADKETEGDYEPTPNISTAIEEMLYVRNIFLGDAGKDRQEEKDALCRAFAKVVNEIKSAGEQNP